MLPSAALGSRGEHAPVVDLPLTAGQGSVRLSRRVLAAEASEAAALRRSVVPP